jgi:hypothetical protein
LPATGGTSFAVGTNARIASSGIFERIYLSAQPKPGMKMRSAGDAIPDLQDGILVLVPDSRDGILVMGELVWSSSPTAPGPDGKTRGNALYNELAKSLRKRLRYPTWGQNVVYGGKARAYRAIGHTAAAAAHVAAGGEMMARESINVRFFIDEPPDRPVRELRTTEWT